jgi:hypothetical protein
VKGLSQRDCRPRSRFDPVLPPPAIWGQVGWVADQAARSHRPDATLEQLKRRLRRLAARVLASLQAAPSTPRFDKSCLGYRRFSAVLGSAWLIVDSESSTRGLRPSAAASSRIRALAYGAQHHPRTNTTHAVTVLPTLLDARPGSCHPSRTHRHVCALRLTHETGDITEIPCVA